MSVPGASNPLLLTSAASGPAAPADIQRSLRFNSGDSAYLSSTASAGSNTTWTLSTWVKKSGTNDSHVFGAGTGNVPGRFGFTFDGSEKISIFVVDNSSTVYIQNSAAVFRDHSAWYHIVIVADTTNTTPADRLIVYVNGERQTLSGGAMPLNQNTFVNTSAPQTIGRRSYTASDYFNGYLADFYLIDGQALDPTYFAAADETTGAWNPLIYSGGFGPNGFHLDFSDASSDNALGLDTSGNGNNFAVNGISIGPSYIAGSTLATPINAFDGSTATSTIIDTSVRVLTNQSISVGGQLEIYTNNFASQIIRLTSDGNTYQFQNNASSNYLYLNNADAQNSTPFTGTLNGPITIVRSAGSATIASVRVDGSTLVDNTLGVDSLFDSPTNGTQTDTGVGGEVSGNYCVWTQPTSVQNRITISNGGLDTTSTTSLYDNLLASIAIPTGSGSWYWEVQVTSFTGGFHIGLAKPGANLNGSVFLGQVAGTWAYGDSGYKWTEGSFSTYGAGFSTVGTTIGVFFNSNTGVVIFYRNNSSEGVAFTGLTDGPYVPAMYARVANTGGSWNFGQRAFTAGPGAGGAAPSGAKALCSANFTDPTIVKPETYMDVPLYTGTSSTQVISGLAFSPDLVWTKSRANNYSHLLYDTVRQATNYLSSNSDSAEGTGAQTLTSFDTDGFTLGSGDNSNVSGNSVAWAWNAGDGSPVSNTDGTITSSVKASPSAGFSIVSWTGTLTASTVGHGLGVTPEMIIVKNRDEVYNWGVYTKTTGNANTLFLDLGNASTPASLYWNSTSPTPSVFSVGAHQATNNNNKRIIAYCFAPVQGYSEMFSFVGNADSFGPFVHLGFRPKYVMIKCSSSYGEWVVFDSERIGYNANNYQLWANAFNFEVTSQWLDICSNGFKVRTASSDVNQATETHIGIAFAENPFKYARAR